jgi:prefoldin subunit 5
MVDDQLTEVDRRIDELRRTRQRLRDVRERLDTLDPADCQASEVCSAIG